MSGPTCRTPHDGVVADAVALLDSDTREWFEERAGIIEFEGGKPRIEAERLALVETVEWLCRRVSPICLSAQFDQATQWLLVLDRRTAALQLAERGATAIATCDVGEVLREQFAGVAVLGRLG